MITNDVPIPGFSLLFSRNQPKKIILTAVKTGRALVKMMLTKDEDDDGDNENDDKVHRD